MKKLISITALALLLGILSSCSPIGFVSDIISSFTETEAVDDTQNTEDDVTDEDTFNDESESESVLDSNSETDLKTETESETESESESETESDTEAEKQRIYRIIYPLGDDFSKRMAERIQEEIRLSDGVLLLVIDDKKGTNKTEPDLIYDFEILVGDTNRTASDIYKNDVGNDGWYVTVDGDKIVVNGASNRGLWDATEYFLSKYSITDSDVTLARTDSDKKIYSENSIMEKNLALKIGSYNIKNGNGDGDNITFTLQENLVAIGQMLKDADLDIVGLQEVDYKTDRVQGLDTVKIIAEAGGYDYYYFTAAMDYKNGQYGTAILSRFPIKESYSMHHTTTPPMEPRALGYTVIDVFGSDVTFINTHLSYEANGERNVQFAKLNELASTTNTFIITGDFNTSAKNEFETVEGAVYANWGKHLTYRDISAIDEIICHANWTIEETGMVKSGNRSDHHLLWATLSYTG